MAETFLNRPVFLETGLNMHRLDVNPEAAQFRATDSGATELEFLDVIAALISVFKPTYLLETGTWHGDGAACLLRSAGPGAHITTFCDHDLDQSVHSGLTELAAKSQNTFEFVQVSTIDLVREVADRSWHEITLGKATFAFLDSRIPDRAAEFEYISEPANGVLDFNRPLCICIHDMSRYRHPFDADSKHLSSTLRHIRRLCERRRWQSLRLHQSRGLLILAWYPAVSGIDGT